MKITKIKVTLRYDNNSDMKAMLRIDRRIDEFKKILAYSSKPYGIHHEPVIEHGKIAAERYIFIVDEVYEGMVMDVINSLSNEGFSSWSEWFQNKYQVACA